MITLVELKTVANYIGLSTDEKPEQISDAAGLPNGSRFLEMDTGTKYFWNADTLEWVALPESSEGGGSASVNFAEVPLVNNSSISVYLYQLFVDDDGYLNSKRKTIKAGESDVIYLPRRKGSSYWLVSGEFELYSKPVNIAYTNYSGQDPDGTIMLFHESTRTPTGLGHSWYHFESFGLSVPPSGEIVVTDVES